MTKKLKLSGFNNLTKVLSFNFYDFCIALNDQQKKEYVDWIHKKYCAEKISEISKNICEIIEAEILNVSIQDYDPVGASTLVLMSDIKGGGGTNYEHSSVNLHLDKSHITAHTYPDADDPNGICTFRVDIDVATCGEIIPLKAINYLFESFECDVVIIDYVVRGYTRLVDGTKIYNDQEFNSIQEFIDPEILKNYSVKSDSNMSQIHTWQTKLMIDKLPAKRYLMDPENDLGESEVQQKMELLYKEMKDVYYHLG